MHVKAAPNNLIQPTSGVADVKDPRYRELGEIGVGDRAGAKQGMTETYLWDAAQSGLAKFIQRCDARYLLNDNSGKKPKVAGAYK